MGTHKTTEKGTKYEDLSKDESFDPRHPTPPATPHGVPTEAEMDAVVAQMEATKAQLPVVNRGGTIGEQLASQATALPFDPEAIRVIADSVIAVVKWVKDLRARLKGG